jgi:hypothetical protein
MKVLEEKNQKPDKKNVSKKTLGIIASIILLSTTILTILTVTALIQTPISTNNENNYSESTSYTIYQTSQAVYAKNQNDYIEISNLDAATVFNYCLQKLADNGGGTLHIAVGEYEIKSQIVIPSVLTPKNGQERCIEIVSERAVLKIDSNLKTDAIYLDATTELYMLKISGLDVWSHSHNEKYYSLHIKDARTVYIENFISGWLGTYLENTTLVHINNFEAVDSANEGLKIEKGGYIFVNNMFIDNCGGWGGIAGYNAILLKDTSRVYFNNFNVFGEKGIYGGQEHGLYLSTVGFSHFSNFQIDGFKKSSIQIDGSHRLTFSDFELVNSDSHSFNIASSSTRRSENITISNFNIFVHNKSKDAIGIYAQESKDIEKIVISKGIIAGEGNGITLSSDNTAECNHIIVSDVVVSVTQVGLKEKTNCNYNIFNGINAFESNGIFTSGLDTKTVNSYNSTIWVSES